MLSRVPIAQRNAPDRRPGRARRKDETVSTSSAASLLPSWKEEVKGRVADHRSRKSASQPETPAATHTAATGRAARAAARVAARYANAPSYSQMLAEEVRAAMRAAQAAQEAAEDAHAAVQMVLAGIEADSRTETSSDLHVVTARPMDAERPAENHHATAIAVTTAETALCAETDSAIDPFLEMRLAPLDADAHGRAAAGFAAAEAAQPIPANLIQFPREMVATRRLRPRRIEGPLAALETAPQLSIFEVDEACISTQPAAPAADEQAPPEWMRPGWAAVEPAPRTQENLRQDLRQDLRPDQQLEPAQQAASAIVDLAAIGRRVMAVVIDGSLTLAGFSVVVWLAAASGLLVHSAHAFGFVAAVLLLLICAGYHTLFSALTRSTPGMWYAGIGLCTIDGYIPNRAQHWRRLAALPLSVMPLGLGLAWSLFDEDRLTWHDRLSGTYLRLR
jgi:uncharacterized RDD family membrane protein YckC